MTHKDLKLQLRLGVKDEGTKQSFDNVILQLKKLEQAGKAYGTGTTTGARQEQKLYEIKKIYDWYTAIVLLRIIYN